MFDLRAAVALALALAGCGDNLYNPFEGLVRVTGGAQLPAGCAGVQTGTNFRGLEAEPHVAVDPNDPMHLIGVWQQDRWSNGGAGGNGTAVSFDGGATWRHVTVPFSRCTGGEFERATDPWVTIGPDGVAYQSALAFNRSTPRHAILASRSTDGGLSWSEPEVLRADDDRDVFNDKEAITADPTDARFVYAVWDRLTGQTRPDQPIGTGPTWFARATSGEWEPARPIFDPGIDAQTIGNVIAVLPDGGLINLVVVIEKASTDFPDYTIAVLRSDDRGDTWSAPVEIARLVAVGVQDPNDVPVRSGTALASIAVDPRSGALYVVWEDSRFTGDVEGIAFSRSLDRGATWSAPRQINLERAAAAFTPTIAVTRDGAIGVSYYDLRDSNPRDVSGFRATAHLATSRDGGETWTEEALTKAFGMIPSLVGEFYFLGDYQGLVAAGSALVPFFVAASSPTDVFVRSVPR